MIEIKYLDSDLGSISDLEPSVVATDKGKQIIDEKPSVTIATTPIHP